MTDAWDADKTFIKHHWHTHDHTSVVLFWKASSCLSDMCYQNTDIDCHHQHAQQQHTILPVGEILGKFDHLFPFQMMRRNWMPAWVMLHKLGPVGRHVQQTSEQLCPHHAGQPCTVALVLSQWSDNTGQWHPLSACDVVAPTASMPMPMVTGLAHMAAPHLPKAVRQGMHPPLLGMEIQWTARAPPQSCCQQWHVGWLPQSLWWLPSTLPMPTGLLSDACQTHLACPCVVAHGPLLQKEHPMHLTKPLVLWCIPEPAHWMIHNKHCCCMVLTDRATNWIQILTYLIHVQVKTPRVCQTMLYVLMHKEPCSLHEFAISDDRATPLC